MTNQPVARGYIGGGHIAAVCGESPYLTPFMAWQEIVGKAPPLDADTERFFARRKRVEPLIFQNLEIDHGIVIARTNVRYTHEHKPHFRAEIDAETDEPVTIEAKSVHHYAARDWGKDLQSDTSVPSHVLMQANWGLGIHPDRPKHAYAVGQVGFDDCRPYLLTRDNELIGLMQERADKFWIDHVLTGVPPPATNVNDLNRMYPTTVPKVVQATPDIVDEMAALIAVRAQLDVLEGQKADHEFAIKTFIGESDTLVAPGGRVLATYRRNKESVVVDWKAIAAFMKAPAKVIDTFTTKKPGNRPFLVK